MKVIKILISVFVLLNLSGCTTYNYNESINDYIISINKINLNMQYEISSIKESVEKIVMFEEYGRPDIKDSNTIIGAHSGNADNAYFNEVYKLIKGDKVNITYNKKLYTYIVREVNEVKDTDMDVLDDKGESILTLLTCKIGDSSKRIVVVATLINGKN